MNYVPPNLEIVKFSIKDNILIITSSRNASEQMEALWSDGFIKN